MRRSTLPPNAFVKSKYRFVVTGLEPANAAISVGDLTTEIPKIEREDKTFISSGRTNGGEIEIMVDLADDEARDAYIDWFNQAEDGAGNTADDSLSIDSNEINGSVIGVNENYKRVAQLIKHRSYQDTQNPSAPLRVKLHGCWITKYTISGADMNADETDKITLTLSYDRMETQKN